MRRLLVLLLLVGCAKQGSTGTRYDEVSYGAAGAAMPAAKSARAYDAPYPAPPPAPPAADMPAEPSKPEAEARMVHYEGYVRLRVTHPEVSADDVSAVALGLGGYVEQLDASRVTIRVPVAKFQDAFDAVLKLGEVDTKSISAEDVTDAFTAVDLRLQTARSTRDRLVVLLAKAKDEAEKVALVGQLREVTEQIDTLEAQVQLYARLADFARITVELEARPQLSWSAGEDDAAFAWVRQLSPFADQVDGKKLPLTVPAGFVPLDVKRRFVAESPEGTRLWTDRLRNEPVGTASFWLDALRTRIAGDFETVEAGTRGGWSTLRLVSRARPTYTWVVLLRVDGPWLDVAQVYYPTAEAEARYGAVVDALFAGGGAS